MKNVIAAVIAGALATVAVAQQAPAKVDCTKAENKAKPECAPKK